MGLFDRLIGNADISTKSTQNLERFLLEGEEIVVAFKFVRDEVVVTNLGVFTLDVQGMTGSKTQHKFFQPKGVKYISHESAGTFDMDADIKIGVDGNTQIVNNVPVSVPLTLKIPSAQAKSGEQFYKAMRMALQAK